MWHVLTIVILLALMIGLEAFNLVPVEEYMSDAPPFTPKSLAATGFIMLAAFSTGELFKRFKLPALLGYIIAGIVFGPQFVQILYAFGTSYLPDLMTMTYGDQPPKALFSAKVISDLALINVLTVGVIGTMGGGELKIADIKESWRMIVGLSLALALTIIPIIAALITITPHVPGNMAPFLQDVPFLTLLSAALLFGILASGMSPAATLAILQEVRAKGRFTSLTLGTVVVADLLLVANFLFGLNLAKVLVDPEGFSTSKLIAALPAIGLEFGWALVIGAATGALLIFYMRYIRKEMMLFMVGVIFAASFVSKVLHAETLLAFLTAGFVVQNFSKHGHELVHELEKISTPVFIVYFMTQAAQLDLVSMITYLPLTLLITVLRTGAHYTCVRWVTKRLNGDDATRRWLWLSFLSLGGVDLVLGEMVAKARTTTGELAFSWGGEFQTVVVAMVIVHVIIGPPLLKLALSGAGETEEERKRAEQAAKDPEVAASSEQRSYDEAFAKANIQDKHLNARLTQMRDHLSALCAEHIHTPLSTRNKALHDQLQALEHEVEDTFVRLERLVDQHQQDETPEALARQLRSLHAVARRKLHQPIKAWERMAPLTLDASQMSALLTHVRSFEPFDSIYVVDMDDSLYNPALASKPPFRVLRRMRSAQRVLLGSLRRMVPLGQLWRYHIELGIPSYLTLASEDGAREHMTLWLEIGRYIRSFDALFSSLEAELIDPVLSLPQEVTDTQEEPGHDDHAHEEHDETAHDAHHVAIATDFTKPTDGTLAPAQRAVEEPQSPEAMLEVLAALPPAQRITPRVAELRSSHKAALEQLRTQLSDWFERSNSRYTQGLQRAYAELLDATELAGTLELTSLSYRPSSRFDEAQRAEQTLALRLMREASIVSGYIGWIIVDHQVALFSHWFAQYQQRIRETLRGSCEERCIKPLKQLHETCQAELALLAQNPTREFEWTSWSKRELNPAGRIIRRALEQLLGSFGQGITSRHLIAALEYRVAGLSDTELRLVSDPNAPAWGSGAGDLFKLSVRGWFSSRLLSEVALRYIEFNERTERMIRRTMVNLESIIKINEELTTEVDAESAAQQREVDILRRAERAISLLIETFSQDIQEVEQWIIKETSDLILSASAPLAQYNLSEIQRSVRNTTPLTELQRSGGRLTQLMQPIVGVAQLARGLAAPVYSEIVEDLRHAIEEPHASAARVRLREQLGDDPLLQNHRLPIVYKRLFNPVPLELPEFYVPRQALEDACLKAIGEWGRGARNTILVHGDRGMGKRTFIHNLVPIRVYDLGPTFQQIPIQTIRFSEETEREADLCTPFASLFEGSATPPKTLQALGAQLSELKSRQIVLIENAHKCYLRTRDGLVLCRDFLQMLHATQDKILWILLMDTPAATLLDTMVDLFDYFTHTFELDPFSPDELEAMIMNRHRVSGFDVTYQAPNRRLLYRTRHPLEVSEARRNPRRDFFRRLHETSHGNPLEGLLRWLRAARLDTEHDTQLHVTPLDHDELHMLETLTLTKRLILATILQHGALSVEQLTTILAERKEDVQIELNHLSRLGFLQIAVGTAQSYQIRDVAVVELTHELRHSNLV